MSMLPHVLEQRRPDHAGDRRIVDMYRQANVDQRETIRLQDVCIEILRLQDPWRLVRAFYDLLGDSDVEAHQPVVGDGTIVCKECFVAWETCPVYVARQAFAEVKR